MRHFEHNTPNLRGSTPQFEDATPNYEYERANPMYFTHLRDLMRYNSIKSICDGIKSICDGILSI